jgi:hypothetical protein
MSTAAITRVCNYLKIEDEKIESVKAYISSTHTAPCRAIDLKAVLRAHDRAHSGNKADLVDAFIELLQSKAGGKVATSFIDNGKAVAKEAKEAKAAKADAAPTTRAKVATVTKAVKAANDAAAEATKAARAATDAVRAARATSRAAAAKA